MAHSRTVVWKKHAWAVGVLAVGLAGVSVLTKGDRDDRSRDLRDAIDGGREKLVATMGATLMAVAGRGIQH